MSRWCIYDYTYGILKYLLAALFLLDYYLTWKHNEEALRGDIATNISSGIAPFMGWLGSIMRMLRWQG